MKVASLLPAATEMVCAMGAEDTLVAVSHECDFPPGLAGLPRVTRSRVEIEGLSRKVHESVTALVENALSVYEVATIWAPHPVPLPVGEGTLRSTPFPLPPAAGEGSR